MGSRRFFSLPPGWRKSIPWGIFAGIIVGVLFIFAQSQVASWNQIDWCGTSVVILFVIVATTALVARHGRDRSKDGETLD